MLRQTFLYLSGQKAIQRWILRLPRARQLGRRFVAGETLDDAVHAVRELNRRRILATLDQLGENVTSREAAQAACQSGLLALETIIREQLQCSLSVKLSQLGLDVSAELCRDNLRALAARAGEIGDFVEVDMEGSAYTDRTLDAVVDTHREHKAVGAVIQAYLYRSEADIQRLIREGVSVRLCKGAYKEPEDRAFPEKRDVDANYRRLMRLLLESGFYHRVATHDPLLLQATRQTAAELGLKPEQFEFQMLYGVRPDLQARLTAEGWRVRVYVPFGTEWFAYFMRRLAERPANAWFALRSVLGR